MTDNTTSILLPSLTGQSKALYEKLSSKSKVLGDMYYGGVVALSFSQNPEYLSHAAHSFRELIEKLPEFIDVTFKARKESLKPKVNDLRLHWDKVVCNKQNYNDSWSGNIDSCLSKYLKKSEIFFAWYKSHSPARNAEAAEMINKIDVSNRNLPASIMDLRIREWDNIRDYFVSVAHHRKTDIKEIDFKSWLELLETFLLDKLSPRTFSEVDEIDVIIAEGEKNDN